MPTAKGKGGAASHRYRPASEYDDATLAQKREYWRNKKREQRARLSGRRGQLAQAGHAHRLPHLRAPSGANSLAASPSPFKGNDLHQSASQSGNPFDNGPYDATGSQKGKWLQSHLNKVSPQLPASRSIPTKAAGANTASGKHPAARGALCRAFTSATSSGPQPNTSSSVPPVRVTRAVSAINGSSTRTAPQPRVSMQGASVPKPQDKAQTASSTQHQRLPPNATSARILVSSPCGPVSIKKEGPTLSPAPQSGTKSALVMVHRAKGVGGAHPGLESEEEKAARRREHWRIKKREQRAKLAARIGKTREKLQDADVGFHRPPAPAGGLAGTTVVLTSQSTLRGAGHRQWPTPGKFSSARKERSKLQSRAANNLQTHQLKLQSPHKGEKMQTSFPVGGSFRKPVESLKRLPSCMHLSSVTRGIARCKTPRQRFIEAQKTFMSLRNLRCKSPLLASAFDSRSMPTIDPNDTPEQIVAKRREYWRIKKREQRAKLSMEVKVRLKEKDSLMRRVKRYQRILEEMRRARAQTAGALSHASETIGGFIEEDGTLTVNLPHSPTNQSGAAVKSEEELQEVSNNQPDAKHRSIPPIRIKPPPPLPPPPPVPPSAPPPPPLRPAQVKVSLPLAGQSANKPPSLLSIRPRPQSTTLPNSQPLIVQTAGQLMLRHPQTPERALSTASAGGSNHGSCVMKMAVSCRATSLSTLPLDVGLTEEERMAKKREYWRIKKREQRAARAVRLKQGVFQARALAALQRRKAQRPGSGRTGPPSARSSAPVIPHANEIKHESESLPAVDLHSQPQQAICPDPNPPAPPPPPPEVQPEPDPTLSADSQATTLLAVASMKKLLEESLSTVTENKNEQTDIKMEGVEEDTKPNVAGLFFAKEDSAPMAADVTLQIKSWQAGGSGSLEQDISTPQLNNSLLSSKTSPLPPPPTSEEQPLPACQYSSHTPPHIAVNPPVESSHSSSSSSPHRTHGLSLRNAECQTGSSPETPKLRDITAASTHHSQLQQQHHQPQHRPLKAPQNNALPPAIRRPHAEPSGLNSLQRKREYWKLMKRQQRARLKARQRERPGEGSGRLAPRSIQTPGLVMIKPKQPAAPLAAVSSIPTLLLVSQPARGHQQPPDTLHVKLPVTSPERRGTAPRGTALRGTAPGSTAPGSTVPGCVPPPGPPQLSPGWTSCEGTHMDSSPSLPTLKPPDNPLSSMNLQPIEPPAQSPDSIRSPVLRHEPDKLAPMSTMGPPKPISGESEEDFLRRKREYWRIKKKEQRARKAIQDRGTVPRRASTSSSRPTTSPQELHTQDCGQWMDSSEEAQHLMSVSVDSHPGSLTYGDYTAPLEDESELLFPDFESAVGEEAPVSDAVWRNRYLMDYDPLNQLLVCMVCGELQYSHGLEGVRAHIDEAHPQTLMLDPAEKQQILGTWDEQVSQRERFFTSQLQQHSGALAEAHRN